MSLFLLGRLLFFSLFTLLNGGVLVTACLNLSTTITSGTYRSLDGYLIFVAAFSVLATIPILVIDKLRRGAVTSRVWFECAWLGVSVMFSLPGAIAATAFLPRDGCFDGDQGCITKQVLFALSWTVTLIAMAQFLLLLVSSIHYSRRHPTVWEASVREFRWFEGGGVVEAAEMDSTPPSPTFVAKKLTLTTANAVPRLERMAEDWRPAPVQKMAYITGEPQLLTQSTVPGRPSTRPPMHYIARAASTVGRADRHHPPQKKPEPSATVSLYPSSVRTALSNSSHPSSQTGLGANPSDEPQPIRNWPRTNPQVPSRPPQKPTTTPGRLDASSTPSTTPLNRRAGPRKERRRPPPLDLSKALPNAFSARRK